MLRWGPLRWLSVHAGAPQPRRRRKKKSSSASAVLCLLQLRLSKARDSRCAQLSSATAAALPHCVSRAVLLLLLFSLPPDGNDELE